MTREDAVSAVNAWWAFVVDVMDDLDVEDPTMPRGERETRRYEKAKDYAASYGLALTWDNGESLP